MSSWFRSHRILGAAAALACLSLPEPSVAERSQPQLEVELTLVEASGVPAALPMGFVNVAWDALPGESRKQAFSHLYLDFTVFDTDGDGLGDPPSAIVPSDR